MLKEIALGFNKRHIFEIGENVSKWEGEAQDIFVSLWDYDDYVRDYVRKNKTLAGYDGLLYMPDEYLLDIDTDKKTSEYARQKAIALTLILEDLSIPYRVYFSGTGFHVGIPGTAFKWQPHNDLNIAVKGVLKEAGILELADPSVTDKTRIIRLVNTRNSKSGLYKIPITVGQLNSDIGTIQELAASPKEIEFDDWECDPVWDVTIKPKTIIKRASSDVAAENRNPDNIYYPCIQKMLTEGKEGERHQQALRIASHLRWRFPEYSVRAVMEDWRLRNNPSTFSEVEMDGIIEACYTGHNGNGIKYGCNDVIMDKYCSTVCRLYKSKKSQNITMADELEKEFVSFVNSGDIPLDIGKNYKSPFPVYKGEFIILIAPPKSMKTTLVQNWLVELARPTYFLEMEMSKRQIWNTFMQIHTGWDEDYLKEHYQEAGKTLAQDFDWLAMDFNRCYAHDIKSKIASLPVRPEIVVVDHMHRFLMRGSDIMHNMSEVSRELTDLAIRENLVVIAIAEMDKASIRDKQFNMGFKGGVDAVYDANKVLGITSVYRNGAGLIEMLGVKSIVNREKEQLDVMLTVRNKKIFKED